MTPVAIFKSSIKSDLAVMANPASLALFHDFMGQGGTTQFHIEQAVMAGVAAKANTVDPVLKYRGWVIFEFLGITADTFILDITQYITEFGLGLGKNEAS